MHRSDRSSQRNVPGLALVLCFLVPAAAGTLPPRVTTAADAPGPAAPMGPPAARDEVAALARGLESPAAAERVRAAQALGMRFPNAAAAVPVLLEAVRDEDAAVRTEAVRALRQLGRAGQEAWVREVPTLSPAALAYVAIGLKTVVALGDALTLTDVRVGYLDAVERGREVIHAALLFQALALTRREREVADAFREASALTIASPWIQSSDPVLSRAAASVVAIIGRATVETIDRGPAAAEDDVVASSPALLHLLRAESPVFRFAGWRLFAIGGPHARTMIEGARRLTAKPDDDVDERGPDLRPNHRVSLRHAARYAALGALEPYDVATPTADGAPSGFTEPWTVHRHVRFAFRRGDAESLATAWRLVVDAWRKSGRSGGTVPDTLEGVERFGDNRQTAAIAAQDLPELFAIARAVLPHFDEWTRSFDATAPSDDVPADTSRPSYYFGEDPEQMQALVLIALARIALRAPARPEDPSLRTLATTILRRQLLLPDKDHARYFAATAIAELAWPRLVPATTLLVSLQAERSASRPYVELALVRALAAVGDVPSTAVGMLASRAAPLPRAPARLRAAERLRYAAGWPHVIPALDVPRMHPDWIATRLAAIDALGAVVGDTIRARGVLRALAADDDPVVRYRVARALRRLGP